jgi:hypothetical protein
MTTLSDRRLFLAWSLGFLTASIAGVALLILPARLQAAGAGSQPGQPVTPQTLQSVEDQVSALNVSLGKLIKKVDSMSTELDELDRPETSGAKTAASDSKTCASGRGGVRRTSRGRGISKGRVLQA